MVIGLIILVIVLVVPVFFVLMWIVGAYNRLVALRNRFKNAFAQIDVQLKRRYDLIPNLVETAKGYIKHERGTLEAVVAARNAASAANVRAAQNPGDAAAMKELSGAETALTSTLGRLFAVAEAYPDLKANTTMMALMEELTSTENKVAFARQAYNDAVMSYNTQRETFPTNMIAGPFNFGPAELFVIEKPEEKEAPKVVSSEVAQLQLRQSTPIVSAIGNGLLRAPGPGPPQHQAPRRLFRSRRRLLIVAVYAAVLVIFTGLGSRHHHCLRRGGATGALESAAFPRGRRRHARRHWPGQRVQDAGAGPGRQRGRHHAGRAARRSHHDRPGRTQAAERRRGNGHRRGRAGAAGLSPARGTGHQRLRRRPLHQRRRRRRHRGRR